MEFAIQDDVSLVDFFKILDDLKWDYTGHEINIVDGTPDDNDPNYRARIRHAEIKRVAFVRFGDGHAKLYHEFEAWAYKHGPKPAMPK